MDRTTYSGVCLGSPWASVRRFIPNATSENHINDVALITGGRVRTSLHRTVGVHREGRIQQLPVRLDDTPVSTPNNNELDAGLLELFRRDFPLEEGEIVLREKVSAGTTAYERV